ncbi:hypothetical protein ACWEPH_28510 [Nocardia beijingensis]|uniref:hypothetical protein n=1 Tax=Nocardia beijingensis TaxID=95162 RepID=UPI001894B07F|nr:hypothetical protein [Nocardia beijingensis]MBF6074080.1 hypothetical protein [Nocardia beijingensis]
MPDRIDDEKAAAQPGRPASTSVAGGVPERGPAWRRMRDLLIVAGDAVLVAVLIGAVLLLGERGTSLDFLMAALGH